MSDARERDTFWVVDRFEGELAVVDRGDGRMLDVPRRLLPTGVGEGDWLRVRSEAEGKERTVIRVTIDPGAGRTAQAEAEQRLLRLRGSDAEGDLEL